MFLFRPAAVADRAGEPPPNHTAGFLSAGT